MVSVNEVLKELFGWNIVEVIGQRAKFLPHVPLELRFQFNRYLKQIKNNNLPIQFRTIRSRKSGLEISVDVKLTPLRMKDFTTGLICEYNFHSVYMIANVYEKSLT